MAPAGPADYAAASGGRTHSAVVPALRPDYSPEQLDAWRQRHTELVAQARRGGFELAFFGDSLTAGWLTVGRAAWDEVFVPRRAAAFGLPGDRTQQLLWRLQQGELSGPAPRAAIVLIGTNNTDPGLGADSLTPRNSPPEIVAGIAAVAGALRAAWPSTRLLVHGLLPRGSREAAVRSEIAQINAALHRLADDRSVFFLDVGSHFLGPDGSILPDIMPDLLHFNARGYRVWADALRAPLARLLDSTP